jgi:hypothetical protein
MERNVDRKFPLRMILRIHLIDCATLYFVDDLIIEYEDICSSHHWK